MTDLNDDELHARFAHPHFEYTVTQCGRKQDANLPEGDGWEPNDIIDMGTAPDGTPYPRRSWQRFDYHEDHYWRRLKSAADAMREMGLRPTEGAVELVCLLVPDTATDCAAAVDQPENITFGPPMTDDELAALWWAGDVAAAVEARTGLDSHTVYRVLQVLVDGSVIVPPPEPEWGVRYATDGHVVAVQPNTRREAERYVALMRVGGTDVEVVCRPRPVEWTTATAESGEQS